jgi:hypothetical protein
MNDPLKCIVFGPNDVDTCYDAHNPNLLVVRTLQTGLHRVLHSTALTTCDRVQDALQFIHMHGITDQQLSVLKAYHGDAKELQQQLVDEDLQDLMP